MLAAAFLWAGREEGVFWSLAIAVIYYTWALYYSFVFRNPAFRRIYTRTPFEYT